MVIYINVMIVLFLFPEKLFLPRPSIGRLVQNFPFTSMPSLLLLLLLKSKIKFPILIVYCYVLDEASKLMIDEELNRILSQLEEEIEWGNEAMEVPLLSSSSAALLASSSLISNR